MIVLQFPESLAQTVKDLLLEGSVLQDEPALFLSLELRKEIEIQESQPITDSLKFVIRHESKHIFATDPAGAMLLFDTAEYNDAVRTAYVMREVTGRPFGVTVANPRLIDGPKIPWRNAPEAREAVREVWAA